ncbi:MAG: hypothetical protein ACE5GT_03015 [Rhodospirillales bacterium]
MKTIANGTIRAAIGTRWRMTAAALAVATALAAWSAAAQAQPAPAGICGERAEVLTTLDGKYAEKPVSMGLASNGTVVEVLNSEDGSWTIIVTAPNGVSCLLAAGDYWQEVPDKAPETSL